MWSKLASGDLEPSFRRAMYFQSWTRNRTSAASTAAGASTGCWGRSLAGSKDSNCSLPPEVMLWSTVIKQLGRYTSKHFVLPHLQPEILQDLLWSTFDPNDTFPLMNVPLCLRRRRPHTEFHAVFFGEKCAVKRGGKVTRTLVCNHWKLLESTRAKQPSEALIMWGWKASWFIQRGRWSKRVLLQYLLDMHTITLHSEGNSGWWTNRPRCTAAAEAGLSHANAGWQCDYLHDFHEIIVLHILYI